MPRRVIPNILGESELDSNSESDEFQSPDEVSGQTDYRLTYSNANLLEPSTSRNAQSKAGSRKVQPTARKRTGGSTSVHIRSASLMQTATSRNTQSNAGGSTSVQTRSASLAQTATPHRRKKKPLHRSQKVLQEIKYLIRTTHLLIPRLSFGRLVKEILMEEIRGEFLRITASALEALHESTELYITQQLQDAYTLTLHRGRVTLHPKDLEVLRFLRGR